MDLEIPYLQGKLLSWSLTKSSCITCCRLVAALSTSIRAGARHVYAVDQSDISTDAEFLLEHNGLSDRVTVVKSKVEDLALEVGEVDVIISEWMGYCLVYEGMLSSVLMARFPIADA